MKPVAWYDPTNGAVSADKDSPLFTPLGQVLPLYPEREWAGLTEEEMWEAVRPLCDHDQIATVLVEVSKDEYRAIEAKLREKNT